jgi:hypothetical protein
MGVSLERFDIAVQAATLLVVLECPIRSARDAGQPRIPLGHRRQHPRHTAIEPGDPGIVMDVNEDEL